MPINLVKVIPQSVIAIGDDGKNKSSNLFDDSLDTHWSYKGRFAFNLIILNTLQSIDSITIHWYMKKKEIREYTFGIYVSETDITIPNDFESAKNVVQQCYDRSSTMRNLTNKGDAATTVKLNGKQAKSILIIYTKSSSKKDWFSVKEIIIMAAQDVLVGHADDGYKWDSIAGMQKPILGDGTDIEHGDDNRVIFFEDDVDYLSENHTYQKNLSADGSASIDIMASDMGGKLRLDKELVVFVRCTNSGPNDYVTALFDGCEEFGIRMDAKMAVFRQVIDGVTDTKEQIDLSQFNLPPLANNWYGLCLRDRRVISKNTGRIIARIMEIKVNPNPFDRNRNVYNSNWMDITAFADRSPPDLEDFWDRLKLEGTNAGSYGVRFLRYCGVGPIGVEDEAEIDRMLARMKNEPDAEAEPEPVKVVLNEKVITVTENDTLVDLDASESKCKIYKWKQIKGDPIELSPLALSAPALMFQWKDNYTTSEFQVTVTNDKGQTASDFVKIINAINQNPEDRKYMSREYNDKKGYEDKYYSGNALGAINEYKDAEITAIKKFEKDDGFEIILRGKYGIKIASNGLAYISGSNKHVHSYLSRPPDLEGKKVGLKFCIQTTVAVAEKAVLIQAYLSYLDVEKYTPWFSSVITGEELHDVPAPVRIKTKKSAVEKVEIREIQPLPEVSNV